MNKLQFKWKPSSTIIDESSDQIIQKARISNIMDEGLIQLPKSVSASKNQKKILIVDDMFFNHQAMLI